VGDIIPESVGGFIPECPGDIIPESVGGFLRNQQLTLLLIEGSLVYYRLPVVPRWLKDDKSWQATISSCFTMGIVGAIFLAGQFLANLKTQHFGGVEIALVALAVVGFLAAWRRLRAIERGLDAGVVPATAPDDAKVVVLPQEATPPETPRPVPHNKGSGGRKAA